MAIRMKDIAKDLGVSITTISKVLHNHKDISPATKERVLRRIKELNYEPSLYAQGLASGQSSIVGLIVPDLVYAFFSEIAKSISNTIGNKGFGLLIASSNEDPELENHEIAMMIRRRVDVLIVASCQTHSKSLRKAAGEVPLILLDRRFRDLPANYVGTNNVLIGEMATEHLLDRGFRRIAHIGGQEISPSVDRLLGYKKALAHHRIYVPDAYVVRRAHSDESGDTSGREAMEELLRLTPRPDAVFCFNDPAAVGAMNAITAAGLRIPEDIAVIGAGNIRFAEFLRTPLSSIEVSSLALGTHVGKVAIQLIAEESPRLPKSILVRPKLVARDSTRSSLGAQQSFSMTTNSRRWSKHPTQDNLGARKREKEEAF